VSVAVEFPGLREQSRRNIFRVGRIHDARNGAGGRWFNGFQGGNAVR
jgi:hypothetical protein